MTSPRPPVVAGVDGSPDAELAVAQAAWQAERRHLPLRLVHAFAPPVMYGPSVTSVYDMTGPLRGARALLVRSARRVRSLHPDLEIGTAVIAGNPGGVLVEESRTAALVVVGSRGVGGFQRLLTGSVSAQVATHAHGPVVVLRPPAAGAVGDGSPKGPVVVGVDGSPGSAAAIEFAFDEAAARGGALTAVYAWAVPPTTNLGPITDSHYDAVEAQDEADRVLAESLAGWQEKYPQVVVARRAIHSLNPLTALLEAGRDAALIVVGPRGHGGFAGLLLGSVSDGLVRHAHRPVAVVHPRPRPAS